MDRCYIKILYISLLHFLYIGCTNDLSKKDLKLELYCFRKDCSLTYDGEKLKKEILKNSGIKVLQDEYKIGDDRMNKIVESFFYVSAKEYFKDYKSKEKGPYNIIECFDDKLYTKFIRFLVEVLLLYPVKVDEARKYDIDPDCAKEEELLRNCYITFYKVIYALNNGTSVNEFDGVMCNEMGDKKNEVSKIKKNRNVTQPCSRVSEVDSSMENESLFEKKHHSTLAKAKKSEKKNIGRCDSLNSSTFKISTSSYNTKTTVCTNKSHLDEKNRGASLLGTSNLRNGEGKFKEEFSKKNEGFGKKDIWNKSENQALSLKVEFRPKAIGQVSIHPGGSCFIEREGNNGMKFCFQNTEICIPSSAIKQKILLKQVTNESEFFSKKR